MQNGNFNNIAASYTTACTNIEAYGNDVTYGGVDATNHVAEIDDESCFYQDVCILSGKNYIFSMKATRRTSGGPNPASTTLTIEGLNAANTVVGAPLVTLNFTRTNTTYALTPVTGIPVVSVPIGSPIVRLRIKLVDAVAGYSTLGMIVDDLNLYYETPPTYIGALAACQFSATPVDINNLPASGVVYSWNLGSGASPATSAIRNPTVTWSVTGVKPVSCVLSNGVCSVDTIRANVDVQSFPAAPTVTSPVNYCQGATATALVATGGTGNILRWYTTPTGGTATTTAPIPDANIPGTTTYYVSQSNTACGEGPRTAILVNVGPKPPPPTVVTPLVYCMGDNALPLTAGGSGLTWYSQPVGGSGTTTPPIPNTAYEDTLTYWVTQTNTGCESIRSKQVVQIRFKPNGIILGTQQSICQGDVDTFYYYGNGRPSFIYNFHTNVGTTTLINDSVAGRYIVRFDSSGTFPIRMQVNNDGCVSNDMFYYVTVRPSPYMAFTLKPDACVGEVVNVALYYTSANVTNYTYDFDNGNIIYGTATGGPYGISWTTPGTKLLKILGVTTGCPSRLFNNSIRIHPMPDASFTASTLNICAGDTIRFKARSLDSDVHYTWTPDNFFVDGNIYSALGTVYQQGYVKLTATSVYGCVSADSLYITAKPCCELFFPNVFSPNNDGHNDVFKPVTIGHHEIANFRIVNRWGQTVFETKDEKHGWDGTFNGRDQDVGTYYYYIKYICTGNQYQEQKGEVMLVR